MTKRPTRSRFLDPAKIEVAIVEVAAAAKAAHVRIAIAGGCALQLYGSDRFTADIDFVANDLIATLPAKGLLSFGGAKSAAANGVPIDIIVRSDVYRDLYDEALTAARRDEDGGRARQRRAGSQVDPDGCRRDVRDAPRRRQAASRPVRRRRVGRDPTDRHLGEERTEVVMATNLRVVRDETPTTTTATEDPALRPTCFADYVGQTEVIANLREAVRAAKREGWQLDHQLFAGPAGFGKTSLATVIATELGATLHATSAPAIEHKGALASLLTSLGDGDVLFIDEIHALDRAVAECLYSAMEDRVIDLPAGKSVIRVPLPKFTLLGATTHTGKLPKPLLDRFGFIWQLRPYTLPEMQTILLRAAAKLGVAMDADGALTIARASRSTPRIANRLLRRVRDAATNAAADGALVWYSERGSASGTINGPLARAALERLEIDSLGLGPLDRRYLAMVAERPVGIEALCAGLAEDRSTLEEVVEPFLTQSGLIARGGRGRIATEAGRNHLRTLELSRE